MEHKQQKHTEKSGART